MSYNNLDEITGTGKTITIHKLVILDEVSVSDGEQKFVAQLARLDDGVYCENDPTRYVIRLGYYTQRVDGWFCFGSKYAPIMTPREAQVLLRGIVEKRWLGDLATDQ